MTRPGSATAMKLDFGFVSDLRSAVALLTVLPLRMNDGRKPGWAFGWFPVVGLGLGALLAGEAWLLGRLGVERLLARGFLLLATWVILTGALHLDGLADSCDGLCATASPERRLEIMKDPRAGSWAVVGVGLLLLGKFAFLGVAGWPVLLVAPVFGRWVMTMAAWAFPYARASGMGGFFRDGLGRRQVAAASVVTVAVLAGASWWQPGLLVVGVLAAVTVLGLGHWAARRLGGGLTGDVYGALCEVTELFCLIGVGVWAG